MFRKLFRRLDRSFRILFRSRTRKLMTPPVFKPRMTKEERRNLAIGFDRLSREGKRQAIRRFMK